jgi:hypothetical protein
MPKASTNELHWASHAWRLMDRVVLWSCAPMFLSDRLVSEGALKLCWLLKSWSMLSPSMVLAKNVIKGEICGLAMVV